MSILPKNSIKAEKSINNIQKRASRRARPSESVSGRKGRVFVGMSGGVDSSVAAYLLKEQGYDVVGVFINSYNIDGCEERDSEDARRVAEHLNIPFYVFDLREEYFDYVVKYMIDGYRNGITPNPDVMCNKEIKFGVFLEKALKLGADFIATGHYVQKIFGSGFELFEAKDKNKDQSYFLWTLTQDQLSHCIFPIGEYTKPEVREIARKEKLPTAEKKDSQGICFLGKVKLPDFLKEYIEPKKGDVLDIDGNKVGEHEGVQFYTIGQRHIRINNLPAGGQKTKKEKHEDQKPYYVVEKDLKRNVLVVAEGDDNEALFKKEVELTDVHFIEEENHSTIRADRRMEVFVRVRYRQPLFKATLIIDDKKDYKIVFDEPQKFVASGQSSVFYGLDPDRNGNHEMLGGGVILR